jgi:L-amino acid N-acyltransferase YncA
MDKVELFKVNTEASARKYGLGCLSNQKHPGFDAKLNWLKKEFKRGLTLIVLTVNGKSTGMIEYTNGENFWRPVEVENYLMIHCLWIIHTKYHKKGYGSLLIDECIKEAKKKKLNGVGVVTSNGPWMAGKQIFLKNGFELIETKGRFVLLVKKIKRGKPPSFINWEENQISSKGIKIVYANQCPMFAKCINDLTETAFYQKVSLTISEMKKPTDTQNAPSGYGVMNIMKDGKVIADQYISSRRFENILKK